MKAKSPRPLTATCRTRRGAERLRQLQATAAEMFLDRGYAGVSVDELIERVGGSRRNVYGPFGSKQGLFVRAVRALCDEVTQPLRSTPMTDADIRTALVLYGRHTLDLLLQPRTLAMHRLMIAEGQRFPALARDLMHCGCDTTVAALALWMASRRQRGDLRAALAPDRLAAQFLDLVVAGPQLQALVGALPADWQPDGFLRHVDAAVDLFLRGAAAPSPPGPA